MAQELGAGVLRAVIVSGDWRPSLDTQALAIEGLLPLLERSEITLALENHFCFSPAELVDLIRRIDDEHVRVCLDPLNSMSLLVREGFASFLYRRSP